MDATKGEVWKAALAEEPPRPPLVPSEKNNDTPASRSRPTREVASRYKPGAPPMPGLAASTPRRCTSPSVSRSSMADGTPPVKRTQSADRRRPSTPSTPSSRLRTPSTSASRSSTPVCDTVREVDSTSRRVSTAKAPDGLWPSLRSLSSSFQSESVATPVNKREKAFTSLPLDQTKVQASAVAERKRSPLRGKNISEQCENARPSENLPSKRAIDQHRWPAMMSGRLSMTRSIDLGDKASRSVTLSNPSRGTSPRRVPASDVIGKVLHQPFNHVARRLSIDGSKREDRADSVGGNDIFPQTSERSKSVSRPSRTVSSPIPVLHRSSSPSKALSTTSSISRGFHSPSRARPSTPSQPRNAAINYIVDARKGKKNVSQIENINQLRLLYNRDLQWHFVNARADDTLSFQQSSVESILYSVWRRNSMLRESVTMKRIEVQHLQRELKLYSILKEQIAYLEQWLALERENSRSLFGAIEALKASTLRLPVTSGARADVVAVKNAVSSAVDVMQAMGSSIFFLLSKVGDRMSLVSELSVIAAQEKVMLDECRELLASAATLQIQESSLRTHLMQLRQEAV